jgi:hypothetical protein
LHLADGLFVGRDEASVPPPVLWRRAARDVVLRSWWERCNASLPLDHPDIPIQDFSSPQGISCNVASTCGIYSVKFDAIRHIHISAEAGDDGDPENYRDWPLAFRGRSRGIRPEPG